MTDWVDAEQDAQPELPERVTLAPAHGARVTVQFSDDEWRVVTARARASGLLVTRWLHELALREETCDG